MYYTLFSLFLVFILWYAFYTPTWLGAVWSIVFSLVIGAVMAWAVRRMREETLEETLLELAR
jgi:hypothetical protein